MNWPTSRVRTDLGRWGGRQAGIHGHMPAGRDPEAEEGLPANSVPCLRDEGRGRCLLPVSAGPPPPALRQVSQERPAMDRALVEARTRPPLSGGKESRLLSGLEKIDLASFDPSVHRREFGNDGRYEFDGIVRSLPAASAISRCVSRIFAWSVSLISARPSTARKRGSSGDSRA